MTSKYQPYLIYVYTHFSDGMSRICEFDIPPNFSMKAFRAIVSRRGYNWRVSQDGGRVVVFRKD